MTVATRTERASTDSSADGGRIELVPLRKSSGSQLVLKGIDLVVESGEFFSLLGPSGCGKTTIDGRVTDVVFVGSTTHVWLDVEGHEVQDVLPNDGAGWVPAPGTSVGVRVPPSAVRILERR